MLAVIPEQAAAAASASASNAERPQTPPSLAPSPALSVSLPFAWSQTDDGLSIIVIAAPNFDKTDAEIDVTDDAVCIRFKGETKTRVCGQLYGPVDRFSAVWQVAKDNRSGMKVLTLELDKASAEKWPVLIKGPDARGLDAHSRYVLAQLAREEGDGEKALAYYKEAADEGHMEATMTLAAFYLLGESEVRDMPIQKDPVQAVEIYKRAAKLGSTEAMYVLGGLYQQGLETAEGQQEADYPMAINWFDKIVALPTAKSTNPEIFVAAAFQAGLLCLEGGHGLGEADPAKALSYWRYSIEAGHPSSMFNAAILFLNGFGTDRDIFRAGRLFAAAQAMDPKLAPPPEIAALSRDQLEKLAALDAALLAKGEKLPIKELLSRFGGSSEAATDVQQPAKKKKAKGAKTAKRTKEQSSAMGTLATVTIAAGVIGLGFYLFRRQMMKSEAK